jgi:hypothetical protein
MLFLPISAGHKISLIIIMPPMDKMRGRAKNERPAGQQSGWKADKYFLAV